MNARELAFEILKEVEEGGNSSYLLDKKLFRLRNEKDRAFATELVLGVLRWRLRLDYAISYHSETRMDKLEEDVRIALRMGIYQLEFMRVPPYAAVNETVKLIRAPWKKSFVNGILRTFVRQGVRYPGKEDPLMYLTYTLSTPEWKARRWLQEFGLEKSEKLARYYNSKPPLYIRVNPEKVDPPSLASMLSLDGIETSPCPFLPGCLKVERGNVKTSPFLKKGYFYVQDVGSQMAGWIIRSLAPSLVWDCCFAPGGKALHLYELGLKVVGSDLSEARVRFARHNMRIRNASFPVLVADARKPPFTGRFELVLVDAPCSSLGVAHRNPELKWRIEEVKLREFATLQLEILRAAAEVADRVLYVVCSQEKEETLEVVERSGLVAEEIPEDFFLSKPNLRKVGALWFTEPAEDQMDGMFFALLRK